MSLPTTAPSDPLAIYSIGLKLRTLRITKGLTLSRLAHQTELSTALLSKLETDHMTPTLHTLERICRVYGISLGHFFCEPQHHSVSITRKAATARHRGDQLPRPIPLHVSTPETHQLAQIIEIPARASVTVGECGAVTELTAYVIEGAVYATIAGSREKLETGDSVVLSTDQPMVWSGEESPCQLLTVFVRPMSAAA
ncbi:helix-turn-helix domain-containing protein [Occallatibacter savannae]|uniref:helix-turn-helix domain-containing protein n=1 Tax=Occallatibacter savannae TaxID=1002691 RepID=UPI000D68A670|nr:helix-turn-helix domain-containing protein [Occallatibacter savannae]